MKGLFITGTDTNVGKTYIACQIASELHKRGINVVPRKPVESGCELINNVLHPSDANLLLLASQSNISLNEVCPYRFEPAISPQIAARHSGEELQLQHLISACTQNVNNDDLLIVEGAGGFLSPICENTLNADLAKALNLPILLVVEDRLGSVNQTLLAINAIEKYELEISAVILNSNTEKKQNTLIDNKAEIQSFTQHTIFQTAFKQSLDYNYYQRLLNL